MSVQVGTMLWKGFMLSGFSGIQLLAGMHLFTADQCILRLKVLSGRVCIKKLLIQPIS